MRTSRVHFREAHHALIAAVVAVGLSVLTAGCATTTVISRTKDGGLRIVSPKDVTIEGLEYRDGETTVRVERYSSAANVEAIRAQFDGTGKIFGQGLQYGLAGLTGQAPKTATTAGEHALPHTPATSPDSTGARNSNSITP